MLKGQN